MLVWLLLKSVNLYQTANQRWLHLGDRPLPYRRRCHYQPSCSEYMEQAITKHGAIKGVKMGLARIRRCNPQGGSGHDPVP